MPWDARAGKLDKSTQAINTIEYEHHEIHSGSSYQLLVSSQDVDSEGDNNALHVSFVTPDTDKEAHMVFLYYASGQAQVTLREAPDGGVTGGTAARVYNRHRGSANTSMLQGTHNGATAGCVTLDASVGTNGTVIFLEDLGTGKNKQAGGNRAELEWVLKRDTTYSIRMSSSTNSIVGNLGLDWYEHTPKP